MAFYRKSSLLTGCEPLSRQNALMQHGAASILGVLQLVLTAQARLDRRSA